MFHLLKFKIQIQFSDQACNKMGRAIKKKKFKIIKVACKLQILIINKQEVFLANRLKIEMQGLLQECQCKKI